MFVWGDTLPGNSVLGQVAGCTVAPGRRTASVVVDKVAGTGVGVSRLVVAVLCTPALQAGYMPDVAASGAVVFVAVAVWPPVRLVPPFV